MAIVIECPACHRQIRAGRTLSGKRVKCPGCGEPVHLVAGQSTPAVTPAAFNRAQEFRADAEILAQAPDYFHRAEGAAEGPGIAGATNDRPVRWAPSAFDEFSPETSEQAERIPSTSREPAIVALSALAFDATQIGYAIQWGLIWTALVSGAGLASLVLTPLVLPVTVVPATWACYVAAVSGIAYLACRTTETGRSPGWGEAWRFLVRRSISLVIGTVAIGLTVAVAVALIYGTVFAVSHVPYVGSILGGVLVIPTFFLVLFSLALIFNLYLLPIIIGVEDCSARTAFGYLWATVTRNSVALYGACLRALASIVPFAAFTGLLTAIGMGGAFALCGGEQVLLLADRISAGGSLQLLSFLSLLAGYLGFVVVFATCGLTSVYCTYAVRPRG